MRRQTLLFALPVLALFACGQGTKETPAGKSDKAGDKTGDKPAEVKRPAGEIIAQVWASPANSEKDRSLLAFYPDGTFSYYVFDSKEWKDYPGTYKIDGSTLIDTSSKAEYRLTIAEDKLTLDNV